MLRGVLTFLAGLLFLPGFLLAFAIGAGGGVAWEMRPADWPNFAAGVCPAPKILGHALPTCVHIDFGDGLAAQLAAANAQRSAAVAEEAKLATALNAQNAAVAALGAEGAKARAEAETAVAAYGRARTAAIRREVILAAPIPGDDECERVKAFDKRFLESLP